MVRAKLRAVPRDVGVKQMFADIAPIYDICNSLMSLRLHRRWRSHAATFLALKPGDCALDVCAGTGDFLPPLRRLVESNGMVFGADFCLPMLRRAKAKPANGLLIGDACRLPVRSGSMDGISVGWGIRNVPDADAAHREVVRVLKRGGRFVSIDCARPHGRLGLFAEWVFNHCVPILGAIFGHRHAYTYLPKSTKQFKSREELKLSMEQAGLGNVGYKDLFFSNICIHWGTKT